MPAQREHVLEKGQGRRPGAPIGSLVVGELAGKPPVGDVGVGEAVADASIHLETPVGDTRLTHLVFEPTPIVGADHRVVGAADHQHAGMDVR